MKVANEKQNLTESFPKITEIENPNYLGLETGRLITAGGNGEKASIVELKKNDCSTDEARDEGHSNFVLEPQYSLSSADTNKDEVIHKTNHINDTENHSCFILESQNTQSADSVLPLKKETAQANEPELDKGGHNYFVLEPHDTYSSIDQDNVIVQTLPENEYNVINMNSRKISREQNSGALKACFKGTDTEDGGEYSHIQNLPSDKHSTGEYSRVNFTTAQLDGANGTVDCYSKLGSTLVRTPLGHSE